MNCPERLPRLVILESLWEALNEFHFELGPFTLPIWMHPAVLVHAFRAYREARQVRLVIDEVLN